jgi:hypothetical protein
MTYAHADTNVLLTIQHTLFSMKGGRKEKASITFSFLIMAQHEMAVLSAVS